MSEGKSVVSYQRAKSFVTDAICEVKGHAERMESVSLDDFRSALYDLLEAIDYLDRTFEGFAADHIPSYPES